MCISHDLLLYTLHTYTECMIQIINASPVEVQEPEIMTTIELCVELIGMFDRAVRFAAVAEELRDIPVEQQALG